MAYADTIGFTLTVTRSGVGEDNRSRTVRKAGGSSYENIAYVTATTTLGNGFMLAKSVREDNSSVCTDEIKLDRASQNLTKYEVYNQYAEDGRYYRLRGRFGQSNVSSTINVQGRFTP